MLNLTPFMVYVFVTTFTPGPNNIMSMSNAMHSGYRRTLQFLTGIFVGFFIVMLLSGLLNAVLASSLPSFKHWLNILGAIYMAYLAVHILRSKPAENPNGDEKLNSFKAGLLMQFLNIKVILYGITVFSLFIINAYQDAAMIAIFSLLLAGVGFVATSCWALGGNTFRTLLQKNERLFNIAMASLLIYTAVASLLM
jgi:cysteine/O-acetylserine efflux protein